MKYENEILKEFGRKIKNLRLHAGLSQKDLAEATGISVNTISRIENGNDCSFSQILKIVNALGKDEEIDNLFEYQAISVTKDSKPPQRIRKSKNTKSQFKWGDEQ